jgi:hypothetical protein
MEEHQVRTSLLILLEALRTGDLTRLGQAIHPATYWAFPGKSRFAGQYAGPQACAQFINARRSASSQRFQLFGEDIGITPFHGVLMFAVRSRLGDQEITSHEILVAGYGEEHFAGIHHYIYELDAFDAFWMPRGKASA